jgi:hypothetical protein
MRVRRRLAPGCGVARCAFGVTDQFFNACSWLRATLLEGLLHHHCRAVAGGEPSIRRPDEFMLKKNPP